MVIVNFMNKNIKHNWWLNSGGVSYSSEFQAVLDRATALGYTQTALKSATDAFISGMVADGDWAEADIGYILATDQADFSRINIISPSNYLATTGGSGAAHTANTGWTSGGAGYLTTGWNPATNGVQYLQDDSSIHIGITVAPSGTGQTVFGSRNSGTGAAIRIFSSAATFLMNSSNTSTIPGGALFSTNLYSFYRTAADATSAYLNGVLINSSGAVSTAIPSFEAYILALNNNGAALGFTDAKIGFVLAGSKNISASNLSSRWATYKTAIGL